MQKVIIDFRECIRYDYYKDNFKVNGGITVNKLKKVFCMLLTASNLCAFIPGALAEEKPQIFFYEGFNGLATNSIPRTVVIEGNENTRVLETAFREKALYMDTYAYYSSATVDTSTKTSNYIISFDVMFDNAELSGSVTLNGVFVPLKFDDKKIKLGNGKEISGIPTTKMTNISIGYCTDNDRYFVAVDYRKVASYVIADKAIDDLSKILIEISDGEHKAEGVYIDNICVYEGKEPVKGLKTSTDYNSNSETFKAVEYDPEAVTPYIEQDFEKNSVSNLVVNPVSSSFTIETEENGNRYYRMEMKSDGFISLYATPRRYIIWQMDMMYESKCPTMEFRLRDTTLTNWDYNLRTTSSAALNDHSNTKLVDLKEGTWTNVAIMFDMRKLTYKVYIDGELKRAETPIGNQKFGKLSFFRLYSAGQELGTICLDNIRVYESKNFVPADKSLTAAAEGEDTNADDASFNISPKLVTDDADLAAAAGAVALSPSTDSIFTGSTKKKLEARPYIKDGYTMIPVRAVSEAFDLPIEWNESEKSIKMGDNAKMTVGSNVMRLKDRDIQLTMAPEIKNGITFIPLRDLGEKILEKEVYYDDKYGLIIISDCTWCYSKSDHVIKQIYNYLFFDRKSADELSSIYQLGGMANKHPRILATEEDFANILKKYSSGDKYMVEWIDYALKEADALVVQPKTPDGEYDTNSFVQYKPLAATNQLLWEARETLKNMKYLGLAYHLTNNAAYARRAAAEMMHVCSWDDWRHTSFLCAAEMATAVAIGYDWCYDQLTDDEKNYIEQALIKNAMNYGTEFLNGRPYGVDFITVDNNWNFVCNTGLTTAALALCDKYPKLSFRMIEANLRSIENGLSSFAPAGGWGEGAMYWDYTMQYACYMFTMLETALKTDLGIPYYRGFADTWRFWTVSNFNGGLNNYHDATAGSNYFNAQWLIYLAQKFDNLEALNAALVSSDDLGGVINTEDIPETCIWYSKIKNSGEKNIDMLSLDAAVKGVEAGSMRSSWDDRNAFAIGFHGGITSVNHYHIDSGTYIIEMGGQRFVSELGSDDYSLPNYFGGEAGIYRKRAEAHALFVIDPSDDGGQNTGTNVFSEIIKTESKAKGAFQVMDLQQSYEPKTESAKRGYMLTDNRHTIIVQDEIELSDGSSDIYWFVPTEATEIDIVNNNTAVFTRYGVKMQVQIVTDIPSFKLMERRCTPLLDNISNFSIQNQNTNFKQLCVEAKGVSGKVTLAMRYTLLDESYSQKNYNLIPIDSWEIPDGEIETLPTLDAIYIDGELIEDYNPTKNTYTLYYGRGTDLSDTELTYDLSEAECTVDIERIEDQYIIKVSKNGSSEYTQYILNLVAIGDSFAVGEYTTYEVWNVNVSDEPQPQNHRYNVIDGNISTYWGSQYDGKWIELDIGSVLPIEGIGYSFMKGNTRVYMVDIEVSDDGLNYRNVYSGGLGGVTTNFEVLELKNVSARYIRLIGHGNSENMWNSVGEFVALHK